MKLLFSYLSKRCHWKKINQNFSTWEELLKWIPGLIPGPLLFDIYLNDLWYVTESTVVCNFADDTTLFVCDKDLNSLIKRLEHGSLLAIEWFQNNDMKLNQDKWHLFAYGYKHSNIWTRIKNKIIWKCNNKKLLGLQINRNLNFKKYVSSLCKKSWQ